MNRLILKSVSWLLSVITLFSLTACGGQGAAPQEPTVPSIDLRDTGYPTDANRAAVQVTNEVQNIVNPLIFGDNLSYRGEGYGIWDAENNRPHETLMEMLKNSGITHLRYPGGCEGEYFHWYETVGPIEERVPQIDPFSHEYPTYDTVRGSKYLTLLGFDEFMVICQEAGIQATISLNVSTGTPQEAVDWIHYAKEKGYDVASWCLGNESHFAEDPVEGVSCVTSPEEYIDFCLEFFELLGDEAEDLVIGIECQPASHPLGKYDDWDSIVLPALGQYIDFVDVHIGYSYYFSSGEDDAAAVRGYMAGADWISGMLEEEKENIRRYAPEYADSIDIQITEYGPVGGTHPNSLAGSLFLASLFHVMLSEETLTAGNHLPMLNHYSAPNLLGSLTDLSVEGKEIFWDNASTYVFRMYSAQQGRSVLSTQISGCSTFTAGAVGLQPEINSVPMADAIVFYDEETGEGSLFVINRNQEMNTRFEVTLPFDSYTVTGVTELWNESPIAKNTYANPEAVTLKTYAECSGIAVSGLLQISAKPISLLKIDFQVG